MAEGRPFELGENVQVACEGFPVREHLEAVSEAHNAHVNPIRWVDPLKGEAKRDGCELVAPRPELSACGRNERDLASMVLGLAKTQPTSVIEIPRLADVG